MSNLRDIANRKNAIIANKKILEVMKIISQSRYLKYKIIVSNHKDFVIKVESVLSKMSNINDHKNDTLKLILISANKGLCGNFNDKLIKSFDTIVTPLIKNYQCIEILCLGSRIFNFITSYHAEYNCKLIDLNKFETEKLNVIAHDLFDESYSKDFFVYANSLDNDGDPALSKINNYALNKELVQENSREFVIDSDTDALIREVNKIYFCSQLSYLYSQSSLLENIARMTSMASSCKNADELIENISIQFNKKRQSFITGGILEVFAGSICS